MTKARILEMLSLLRPAASKRPDASAANDEQPKAADRFAELAAGLNIDDAIFARQMARLTPADKCYIILFTPRSGSSWLADLLTGTGRLGWPGECLNEKFIRRWLETLNARDQAGLLAMLKRRRKSANGVFGIKVTYFHVLNFGEDAFFDSFGPKTVSFFLWRENIVAQAISICRQQATGRGHSDQQQSTGPNAALPPPYNAARIRKYINHLTRIENDGLRLLDRHGHKARMISYEEIVKDKDATCAYFCRNLEIERGALPNAVPLKRNLKKIADSWNEQTEAMFRSTEHAFIAKIEPQRLARARAQAQADRLE